MADTATHEYLRNEIFEQFWKSLEESRAMNRETDRLMQENARRQKETEQQMKETDRRFKETEQLMKETDRRQKETDRQMKETDRLMQENAQRQKETDRQMEETDRRLKETEQSLKQSLEETSKMVKETSRQMGLLNNRFGELAEHLVAPGMMKKFNKLGFHFSRTSQNIKIQEVGSPYPLAEIDVLLENGDIVIVVEIKAKPDLNDIHEHIERIEKLRGYADRRQDKRKYRGAIAAAILNENIRREILNNGFYVIVQSGDTLKIDIPQKFVPRDW